MELRVNVVWVTLMLGDRQQPLWKSTEACIHVIYGKLNRSVIEAFGMCMGRPAAHLVYVWVNQETFGMSGSSAQIQVCAFIYLFSFIYYSNLPGGGK